MDTKILSHLRRDARNWWYHKQLRKRGQIEEARRRERALIMSSLQEIRETLQNDGYMTIARGGVTLHCSPNRTVSGLHPGHIDACIAAGIPTLDSNGVPIEDVAELSISGPMPGFKDDQFGSCPDSSLSTRQWRIIFNRYAARGGAVFYNYDPEPEQWSPRHEATP